MNNHLPWLTSQPSNVPARRRSNPVPGWRTACLLLPLSLLLSVAAAAPPRIVGQLLNVSGDVEVQRANEPVRKGTLLFQLHQGDVLKVRSGGGAEVVLFQNGARLLLSGPSAARVGSGELKP